MSGSRVVPATSAKEKISINIAGSATVAIIISAAGTDAAETGADVEAGERQDKARAGQDPDNDDEIARRS